LVSDAPEKATWIMAWEQSMRSSSSRTRRRRPAIYPKMRSTTHRRWGPHHKLESRPNLPFNGSSNGL
jgi:hypothetical protein